MRTTSKMITDTKVLITISEGNEKIERVFFIDIENVEKGVERMKKHFVQKLKNIEFILSLEETKVLS